MTTNRSIITKGMRVTLPLMLKDEFHEMDVIEFEKVPGGFLMKKFVEKTKELFAAIIGETEGHWYGIVLDEYGIIKLRIRSSTVQYLAKDLTEVPDPRMKQKLTERCGDKWQLPKLVEYDPYYDPTNDQQRRIMTRIRECRDGLKRGEWPPKNDSN